MRANKNQYDNEAVAFSGAGQLALITGFNAGVNTLYFYMVDAAAIVGALAITAAYEVILLGPGANFSYRPSEQAKPFGTGLVWGVSSTAATYTSAADLVFVHTEYNLQ